jgi:superfamily II DNA/RNA helicase
LHRLGRTGRAGQEGNGLLVLLPFESRFRSKCYKNQIVENVRQFQCINEQSTKIDKELKDIHSAVRGGHSILTKSAEAAYISYVAHYLEYGRIKNSNADEILDAAKDLAVSLGLTYLPTLPDEILAKVKPKQK